MYVVHGERGAGREVEVGACVELGVLRFRELAELDEEEEEEDMSGLAES